MIYKKYAEVLQIASPLYVQHTWDFSPMSPILFCEGPHSLSWLIGRD